MTEFRPLYAQIRDGLIARISAGEWAPGDAIPAETALAAELEVSQGTVRKALDQLCADGVLRRSQGRGTFVAEQTPELANFRFFRLTDRTGERVVPELARQTVSQRTASEAQAASLGLASGALVHVIDRLRLIDGVRAILEDVVVPDALMPGLDGDRDLPNALYPYYQSRFGISVLRTQEQLSAVSADEVQARRLQVPVGTALLRVRRTAFDLTGRAVELRTSHFVTDSHSFSVSLQ